MGSRTRLVGGVALTAVAALAGVLVRPDLPGEVAIHFGPSGTPDSYVSRDLGLALLPGLMLVVLGVFEAVPRIDPLRENIDAFERVYDLLALAIVGFLGYVHGLVLAFNLDVDVPIAVAVSVGVGALYVVLGAAMREVERNWAVGFRTPWTLSDDVVWEQTHRYGALAMVAAGVVTVAGALLAPDFAVLFVVGSIVAVAVYTFVYSYVLYRRRHPDGDATAP